MRYLLIRLLYWLLDRLEDDWTDCGTALEPHELHKKWLESYQERIDESVDLAFGGSEGEKWAAELTEELRGKK